MAKTNTLPRPGLQVSALEATTVADFMRRSRLNGDDLIFAIDRAFPGLSLRTFAGALALYRARRGDPAGYALVFPTGGGVQ